MFTNISALNVQVGVLISDGNPNYISTSTGHSFRRKTVMDALLALGLELARTMGDQLNETVTRCGIETFLTNPHLGHYVVAWDANNTVVAALEIKKIFEVWEDSPYWYVDNYVVFPEYRDRGIGTKMLNFVKEMANAEKISRVRLFVIHENPRGKNFYVRHRFNSLGEFMEFPVRGSGSHAVETPSLEREPEVRKLTA